jgi:hypothetical protein
LSCLVYLTCSFFFSSACSFLFLLYLTTLS